MEERKNQLKEKCHSILICRICGGIARGMNYGVITCMSCKTFFRRNALKAKIFRCTHQSNCEITKERYSNCPSCRLHKCFLLGMNTSLIRCTNQYKLTKPRPLDLLENDRSNLTDDQWNLLSNIHHVYDEESIVNLVQYSLNQGLSLPLKLRIKSSFALNCLYHCFSSMEYLFKRSTYFDSLPLNAKKLLVNQNIYATSSLQALYITRQANLWNNEHFQMSFIELYDSYLLEKVSKMSERLDPNGILIKIMLYVISFSTNYSILHFDNQQFLVNEYDSYSLVSIQHTCATLLWKYLIYQHGFNQAVSRYSSLIKTMLDILAVLEHKINVQLFDKMMNDIVKQTEHSLILQN
ncbi:unnamed protein product [Adineta steineri]|uniref:Nuclear receptor domain-containing protein n=1 Tax=Adineta steineri TaxID=433720 RepID=A0A814QDR4_9BILA|nr:unnamed protein product [Adineta steineri]